MTLPNRHVEGVPYLEHFETLVTNVSQAYIAAQRGEHDFYHAMAAETAGERVDVAASRRHLIASQFSLEAALQNLRAIERTLGRAKLEASITACQVELSALGRQLGVGQGTATWAAASERRGYLAALGESLSRLLQTTVTTRLGVQYLEDTASQVPLARSARLPSDDGRPAATRLLLGLAYEWTVVQQRWLVVRVAIEQLAYAAT